MVAYASPASQPASSPQRRRANHTSSAIVASVARYAGRRAAASVGPTSPIMAAVAAFVRIEQAVAVQVPAKRDRREQDEQRQADKRARWRRRRGLNKLGVWVI